jgi:hypothetical protein
MRKPHFEALPKRLALASTGLESGHSKRRPVRQKELVKVPEDATVVNALRKRDVPPKRRMEAAQSVSQKLPEPAKPVADPAEQKRRRSDRSSPKKWGDTGDGVTIKIIPCFILALMEGSGILESRQQRSTATRKWSGRKYGSYVVQKEKLYSIEFRWADRAFWKARRRAVKVNAA